MCIRIDSVSSNKERYPFLVLYFILGNYSSNCSCFFFSIKEVKKNDKIT